MDTKTWQHLLGLESVDVVRRWFHEISGLQLSKTRADEIASAAKQSREYFNNASNAASIVKSLLTFYGVASLARSMILLLKRDGGEITLGRGHGLNTIDWPSTLSGEIPTALRSIGNLKIRTSAGLFNDLVRQTSNLSCIHLRSSTVDWRIRYPQQEIGFELTFEEILSRVPDLMKIVNSPSATHHLASVNEVTCSARDGFQAMINPKQFELFQDSYINEGYAVTRGESLTALKCTFHHFQTKPPQFMHAHINKAMGLIPNLFIVKPFSNGIRLSELSIIYMLSFILGMLTRYYPTHWVALQNGTTGDALWPTVHAAQKYVETVFPELVIEFINEKLKLPPTSPRVSLGAGIG